MLCSLTEVKKTKLGLLVVSLHGVDDADVKRAGALEACDAGAQHAQRRHTACQVVGVQRQGQLEHLVLPGERLLLLGLHLLL